MRESAKRGACVSQSGGEMPASETRTRPSAERPSHRFHAASSVSELYALPGSRLAHDSSTTTGAPNTSMYYRGKGEQKACTDDGILRFRRFRLQALLLLDKTCERGQIWKTGGGRVKRPVTYPVKAPSRICVEGRLGSVSPTGKDATSHPCSGTLARWPQQDCCMSWSRWASVA
ncbi:hypothetical protein EJ02DRAFT_455885 [Clathrospora elynae]|uniref:Uncharacterized protein n=1 Tax=Clathrospora elynae TaxID=706981 RepID=A0A6A5SLN1_9PLEO|nr:hypothetical protein EJ02DRAFT_455885 [Clathrospora elynae]